MEHLKERQKLSFQGMFYSIQRIDLLIVTFCGAGIYICLESIKFLKETNIPVHILIKITGFFFVLGLIVNFTSQILGYHANKEDWLMLETEIKANGDNSKKVLNEIENHDKTSDFFSKWTEYFNYISMSLMLVGIIFLMYYFAFIF